MSSGHTSSIHNWYTFDELDLESISEAPAQAAVRVTEELRSFLKARPRNTSHLYTHRAELHRSRYNGISFKGSSKRPFEESDEDINALERRVEEKSAHNWDVKGDSFDERKLDVSLEKDGDDDINSDTLRWYHMLCVLGFNKSQRRKHPREEEASNLESRKRGSIITGEPISTTITASVDGTASGIGLSARELGTATRASTGAKASDAGPSTGGCGTAAISSTGTSSQPTALRRSQRLATFSNQADTLPELMGPPAPVAQVSPSTQSNNQPIYQAVILNPCAEDSSLRQLGENPTDQVPQDSSDNRERPASTAFADSTEVQFANCAMMLSVFLDRLLHRDISIANMVYYMTDERNVATLIDFDLATFPDEKPNLGEVEPSGTVGSVNGSASSATVVDTPVVSHVPGAPASLFTAAIAGGKGNNGKCQNRTGTTPFMAVETLDLHFPGYVYHLCHDLESLFYAIVWHGVGYRRTDGIHPYATDLARQKVDILRGWRVGPWSDVADRKDLFLIKAENTLQYMKHPGLQDICGDLSLLFQQRMIALRGRERARKVAASSAASAGAVKRQDVKRRAMNIVYNQPIFPSFADIWGFERVECQKSCCAN